VNLPARCVVIRDTRRHDPLEGETEMSPLDVLQMLGRAGRPGYDDRGYAWIVCEGSSAKRYRDLLAEGKRIESRLADGDNPGADDLTAHLNAEIALGNVRDVDDAMGWLETTFYYVRASTGSGYASGARLRDQVSTRLDWLVDRGFVDLAELRVEPTPLGRLASVYYLELPTARRFADLVGANPDDDEILQTVAAAAEFDSVTARSAETDAIAAVLGEDAAGLDAGTRKVLAILRSSISNTTPSELQSDAWVIRQNALRLLAALRAVLEELGTGFEANRVRRLAARVETGVSEDAVGLTAIDGVGRSRARRLAAEGYRTPADVAAASTAELDAAGIDGGVADRLRSNARDLPAVAVDWGQFPETVARGDQQMQEVTVRSTAGDARASLAVTVNGVEMTAESAYLGETTLLVGVFGSDTDELEFEVRVTFPDLPLAPLRRSRTVDVLD